jgi:hypothetical protein
MSSAGKNTNPVKNDPDAWNKEVGGVIGGCLFLIIFNWEKVENWLLGFARLAGMSVGGLKMVFTVFWPTFFLVGIFAFGAGFFLGRKK